MDEKPQFCDEWTEVGLDYDHFLETGEARLEFKGAYGGCGHCSEGITVQGTMKVLSYLEHHEREYLKIAAYFTRARKMIREYGEERIARSLVAAYKLSRYTHLAENIAMHDSGNKYSPAEFYPKLVGKFPSWEDAAKHYLQQAINLYSAFGTFDKMVTEFFEPHVLCNVAEDIGKLVGMGYDTHGYDMADLSTKETKDE
jgi:hypothetical protein